MTELPSMGVSATRIEQLRDAMLVKMEGLVNDLDTEDNEEMVQQAETIVHLSEAFINLR